LFKLVVIHFEIKQGSRLKKAYTRAAFPGSSSYSVKQIRLQAKQFCVNRYNNAAITVLNMTQHNALGFMNFVRQIPSMSLQGNFFSFSLPISGSR